MLATPLSAAQLTLSSTSLVWHPAFQSPPSLTVSVASDSSQEVLFDRLTSWQLELYLVPQVGTEGTLGFATPSLPEGYLLAGQNFGLFQGPSPSDRLLVGDSTRQGNTNAVVVPLTATPLIEAGLTQRAVRGVFYLVARRGYSLWTGRESLDPAEREFANFTSSMSDATLATITVMPALLSDANSDCTVGAADYAIWAAQFGQTGSNLAADFDFNGSVGAGDYVTWAANFGKTCSPPDSTSVPEPATWVLALSALGTLLALSGARPAR